MIIRHLQHQDIGNAGAIRRQRHFRFLVMMPCLLFPFLCGNRADGSCGDYLYRNGRPVSMAEHDTQFTSSHEPVVITGEQHPDDRIQHSQELPQRRCSGPNCSQSPSPLVPAPVVPVNLRQITDSAAFLESLLSIPSRMEEYVLVESESGTRYVPFLLFRPPAV